MITELRIELRDINQSILALERISQRTRRGRPPASLKETAPRKRGRPKGSKNKPKDQPQPLH
jgi:hypothetical protein